MSSGLSTKVKSSTLSDDDGAHDSVLELYSARKILAHLETYEYAPTEHVL